MSKGPTCGAGNQCSQDRSTYPLLHNNFEPKPYSDMGVNIWKSMANCEFTSNLVSFSAFLQSKQMLPYVWDGAGWKVAVGVRASADWKSGYADAASHLLDETETGSRWTYTSKVSIIIDTFSDMTHDSYPDKGQSYSHVSWLRITAPFLFVYGIKLNLDYRGSLNEISKSPSSLQVYKVGSSDGVTTT